MVTVLAGAVPERVTVVLGEMHLGTVNTLLGGFELQFEDCCIGLGALGVVELGLEVRIPGAKFVLATKVVEIPAVCNVTDRPGVDLDAKLETCAGPN